jgi:2-polyprenyl-6-methoxyphenol hydroxylase-like FAD-dependent oxidoreductase
MKELGIYQKLILSGAPVNALEIKMSEGTVLSRVHIEGESRYGAHFVALRREVLIKILEKNFLDIGGKIHYEKKLIAIDNKDASVKSFFADGSREVSDVLIGADGVHSAVRKSIFPRFAKEVATPLIGIGGFIEASKLEPHIRIDEMSLFIGDFGLFGCCGASDSEFMWWSSIARDRLPKDYSNFDVKHYLKSRHRKSSDQVQKVIEYVDHILMVDNFTLPPLESWSSGRVCLIGDAAHPVLPDSGQGASMALEDAALLAEFLSISNSPENAFSQFEQERRKRVLRVKKIGDDRARSKIKSSGLSGALSRALLPTLFKLKPKNSDDWLFGYKAHIQ